ncbi:unnamed protein product [Vicia faba]|uniref:Transposase Tnp1/En/Spm-like domain-containing protein n=1 Tax=Vicia faba TaxID=3906 RepID=A0AAV0ZNU7_VICFA|nr:unnamed protein product [Vicia faba]
MDLQCYNEVAALFMLLRFDLFIIYSKLSKNFAALGSLNKLIEGCGTSITPAHEKIGVVDEQWIVHQTIPTLGERGEYDHGKDKYDASSTVRVNVMKKLQIVRVVGDGFIVGVRSRWLPVIILRQTLSLTELFTLICDFKKITGCSYSVKNIYKLWLLFKAFIIGEEHRAFVYREAGKLHRAFRTKMARSYLKDSKGGFVKHRPAKYSFCIKQDDWDKFVAQHMTAKFQKVSDENRERALNPQHPYRKSRLGCARLEADMVEESEVGEINRSQVWKAARVNKSGVIDNENVQRVVDQCEKLTEALSEEERQDLGPTNILFEALNLPNYSGRVRTYGFGVCSRDILPRQNRPTQMDFEKLYGFCNSLKSRLEVLEREKIERDKLDREKLERQQTEEVEERQQPKQVSERLQQPEKVAQRQHLEQVVERKQPEKVAESRLPSDKGSCNPGSFGNIPEGLFPVNIYLSSPSRCLVARGKLYNTKDGDVSMVGQAIGTIVPWPTKLLEFVAECEKIPGQSQNKAGIANLPFLDMYVKKMMRVGSLIQIKMEESIFGEEFLEQLRVESIKEILDHNWLSASIITVFSRYLYDKFISPNGLINKFSFISPHVSREDNLGNGIYEFNAFGS